MPVKEFPCPECGAEVPIGLPRGGTVKSITTSQRPETTDPARKARRVRCGNDHDFFVLFEW